jgi:uncharacterized damage-inducible protein DinB
MEKPITLKQVLLQETERTYAVTEKLFRKVDDSELGWKPETGRNWMNVGQLLMHCADAGCGKGLRGFIRGDWGLTGEEDPGEQNANHHLPTAEELPYVDHVEQALKALEQDKALSISCLNEVEEADLLSKRITAPWGGLKMSLFQQLWTMIAHLVQHKGQLFYYLKLMGKNVDSSNLWGEM